MTQITDLGGLDHGKKEEFEEGILQTGGSLGPQAGSELVPTQSPRSLPTPPKINPMDNRSDANGYFMNEAPSLGNLFTDKLNTGPGRGPDVAQTNPEFTTYKSEIDKAYAIAEKTKIPLVKAAMATRIRQLHLLSLRDEYPE